MIHKEHPWIGVDNIIINDNNQILLVKRATTSRNYPNTWGLVSGWIECNETAAEACKREAREEIGVEIEIVKYIGRYYDKPRNHSNNTSLGLPHICKIIKGEPRVNQPEEIQDVRWFNPEDIRNMELAYDNKKILQDERLI